MRRNRFQANAKALAFIGVVTAATSTALSTSISCSDPTPPPNGSRTTRDAAASTDTGALPSVGSWECYPEVGLYTVRHTRVAGDEEDCPDIPEMTTEVIEWTGDIPQYPYCVTTGDEATCTLVDRCQYTTSAASTLEITTTVYAGGQTPPARGTRERVTGKFIAGDGGTDGGDDSGTPVTVECKYEFVYSKN